MTATELLALLRRAGEHGLVTDLLNFLAARPTPVTPPAGALDRRARDAALRQIAENFRGISTSRRVAGVLRLCRRYSIRWSRVDRHRIGPPPDCTEIERLLWTAFQSGGGAVPTSRAQLYRILGDISVRSASHRGGSIETPVTGQWQGSKGVRDGGKTVQARIL
jgi:hypothetical protein